MSSNEQNNHDVENVAQNSARESSHDVTDDKKSAPSKPKQHATTTSVADSMERVRNRIEKQSQAKASSITLNILGVDTPITFQDRFEIVLGRVNPSTNERPDVDLSGLPVNVVGVSRQHLKLVYSKGSWFAEDMGSRNGSRLNSKLMTAYQRYNLRDGDQIHVGNVIVIVILNSPVKQSPEQPTQLVLPSASRIVLSTAALVLDNQQGFSPHFVTHYMMPYLQAVIEMMQHVDRAKKRSQREISMTSITFAYPNIRVDFNTSNELLQFMLNEESLRAPTSVSESDNATSVLSSETMEGDPIDNVEEQAAKLSRKFAEQYLVLSTTDQSLYYQRLLTPLMQVCIESHLWIAE